MDSLVCVCVLNIFDDDYVVLLWILLRCELDIKCEWVVYMCIMILFERLRFIFRLGAL